MIPTLDGLRAELEAEDWHRAKSVMALVREEEVVIPVQDGSEEGSAGSASRMDSPMKSHSVRLPPRGRFSH